MIIFLVLLIFVYSVIMHEIAHGLVAYANGDPTAKRLKRLTLNPVPHVDLMGTLVVPLTLFLLRFPVLFGWAKPVPVDPGLFRNPRLGLLTVSLVGPLTNFALAYLMSFVLKSVPPGGLLFTVCFYAVSINIILAIFNLIPVPPTDGSKIIGALLPGPAQRVYFSMERWGMIVILALLYLGLMQKIILPVYFVILKWMIG